MKIDLHTQSISMTRLRKQINSLVPLDLELHPVWEFALDEEGEPDQDETTVRPVAHAQPLHVTDFVGIARAEFVAADGIRFDGYVSPSSDDDLANLQPVIVLPERQILFWHGVFRPSSAAIQTWYQLLHSSASRLFPLHFSLAVPIAGAVSSGRIDGFVSLRSALNDDRVIDK